MAATTAASLLGLVSHLQSMESAFTGVLLESALKLSNVTDANVFILVETSEGRQWAGNRHLKEEFLTSGLHPCPGDVECAIDPSKQLIRGKPYPPFPNLDAIFQRQQQQQQQQKTSHMSSTPSLTTNQSLASMNEVTSHSTSRPEAAAAAAAAGLSCRSSPSPMAAPTSSGGDVTVVTSAAESMQWPRKRAASNSNSEVSENATPAKISCPNEKSQSVPQPNASGSGGTDEEAAALMSELPASALDSILADAVKVKEEHQEQGPSAGKNECDSTRNGDTINSGDEDSNHRCEVIETKPVSLNPSQHGESTDSSNNSMDLARMTASLGDMGGAGSGGGNPGLDMLHLGRLREAFGNNCAGPGSSGFLNGIFANALGGGPGKINSFMNSGFHGPSGYNTAGPSNQLPGIAQSFSSTPAWASGSMDMSNLFRNRTQFTDEQVAVLKAYYDVDKYPNAMRVAEIAAKIGVHVRVVNVWFQNARAKEKRNMKWPN